MPTRGMQGTTSDHQQAKKARLFPRPPAPYKDPHLRSIVRKAWFAAAVMLATGITAALVMLNRGEEIQRQASSFAECEPSSNLDPVTEQTLLLGQDGLLGTNVGPEVFDILRESGGPDEAVQEIASRGNMPEEYVEHFLRESFDDDAGNVDLLIDILKEELASDVLSDEEKEEVRKDLRFFENMKQIGAADERGGSPSGVHNGNSSQEERQ